MEELNVPIFAQAKVEYTNQLVDVLYPHMYDGVKSIYEESKVIHRKKTSTPILLLFRELLEKVPIWNSEIIESECSRIMNNSKCDWIDDLITAVFISHTKILTSIGPNSSFNKINVTIPKTTSFIHKSYVNLARELWKNPYLFNENVPGHEFQRNSKEIENIIKQCVEGTIRQLLPIKEILREHLDTYENDNSATSKEDIKKLLKEELQELKNSIINSDNNDNDNDNDNDNESPEEDNSFKITREDLNEDLNEKSGEIKELVINDTEDISGVQDNIIEAKVESEPTNVYLSEKDDDPTEEQINKQVDNIVVNDITIPVDVPDNLDTKPLDDNTINNENNPIPTPEVKEVVYDNADIMVNKKEEKEDNELKVKKMLTNLEPMEVNVIKNENINTETDNVVTKLEEPKIDNPVTDNPIIETPIQISNEKTNELSNSTESSFKLDSIFGMGSKPEEPKAEEPKVEEPKVEEPKVEEPKKEPKEIINIDSNDIDETSSLANFFNDMKKVVEDKGINVENSNNFTLFEDASEVG